MNSTLLPMSAHHSWDAMLMQPRINLELITDPEMDPEMEYCRLPMLANSMCRGEYG